MSRSISKVVSSFGQSYEVGDKVNGHVITMIKMVDVIYEGDPYLHYAGYTDHDEIMFAIAGTQTALVEYFSDTELYDEND